MRAMLLAAGYGTRLKPLTDKIPKCLVPIKDKPLLEYWLEELNRSNFEKVLINTHYLHEKVESFINNSKFKKTVNLIYEPILLGTAGTIIKNIDFFNGNDCIVIHADNYTKADLSKFVKEHLNRPKECLMSMMTFRSENPKNCGIIEVNQKNIVTNFEEKNDEPTGNLANCAVYIITAELLEIMSNKFKNSSDFSTQIIPELIGRIYSIEISDVFIDIGTPQSYKKANKI